jgi:anti-sigma-K factor RskA
VEVRAIAADLHALSGAYVLDAVDDAERAAFDRHLSSCEPCRSEVDELREVVARLGGQTDDAPPPGLRGRVLDAVSQTPQLEPEAAAPGPAGPPGALSAGRSRLRAPAGPRGPRRPGGSATRAELRWRRATIAVAAAALVTVAGTFTMMNQRLRHEHSQVVALRQDRDRIYDVMNAKDVLMKGDNVAGGGRFAAAISPSQHAGVAMVAGLHTPPPGDTFEMWLVAAGVPHKAVVLDPGVTGGTMLFPLVPGAQLFTITYEPVGGSPQPTHAPLGTVDLTHP